MAATGGPSGLQGKTDLELKNLINIPDEVAAMQAAQDLRARAGTLTQRPTNDGGGLAAPWGLFQARNVAWLGDFWQECRALYAGGPRLLNDPKLLERLFPANRFEPRDVYAARKQRAHYYPYAGTIIDSLLSGLSSDPLRIAFGEIDEETGEIVDDPKAEWWRSFVEDVSDQADDDTDGDNDEGDSGAGETIHHFMIRLLRECEQTQFTWVRCDMPPPPDPAMITSRRDEDDALQPYLCLVPAETVIDWEYDSTGTELQWVLMLEKSIPRKTFFSKRGKVEHQVYTLWTQSDWTRWEIDYDPANAPSDTTTFSATAGGIHSFGCVPFIRVMLPEGLWAMGKLHSLAREHFNKRCAMSWAEYKALFPILYEFLDNSQLGDDLPTVGADDNRATDQTRAQGYTQTRRANDKAQFIGPDAGPFKEARDSCNDAMREMHRVMFSMALSANMDAKALSRSGDSKEQDSISTKVVLLALGQLVRRFVCQLFSLVARGTTDKTVPDKVIQGLEHFDVTGVTQAITDAVQVFSGIPIAKSPLAFSLYLTNLLRKILGDSLTDSQVETIREQIEERMTAEQEMMDAMQGAGATPATEDDPNAQKKPGDDNDDPSEDRDVKPAAGPIRSMPNKYRKT